MFRTEKEELIIKLRNEGYTWDEIAHKVHTSPKTISKVLADYEQSEAFKLFERNYSPMQVRIELSIPAENVEKHYLTYRKLYDLVDLSSIYDKLGSYLPEFLNFYYMTKSFNITPENMHEAINLAKDIENLEQEGNRLRARIYEIKKVSNQEAANLAEIQRQAKIVAEYLQGLNIELSFSRTAIDKIRNSDEYRNLEDMIREAVNSLGSEQYFIFEAAVIAVMRTIQKVPSMIPLLQFPFPHELDMTAHSSFHQYTLTKLVSTAAKFMPEVLEELTKLTKGKVLPQYHKLDAKSNKGFIDQTSSQTSPIFQSKIQRNIQSKEHFDYGNNVSPPVDSEVFLKYIKTIYQVTEEDWDALDASWYYML